MYLNVLEIVNFPVQIQGKANYMLLVN